MIDPFVYSYFCFSPVPSQFRNAHRCCGIFIRRSLLPRGNFGSTRLCPWLVSRGPIVPRDQLWHYASERGNTDSARKRERESEKEERQSNGAAEKAEMGKEGWKGGREEGNNISNVSSSAPIASPSPLRTRTCLERSASPGPSKYDIHTLFLIFTLPLCTVHPQILGHYFTTPLPLRADVIYGWLLTSRYRCPSVLS